MLGTFDHVGHLVRDLDAAVAHAERMFGLSVARTIELPQFGVAAVFLGEGTGTLELFTLADRVEREARLGGAEQRLDHVAFRVEDIDAAVATLAARGASFSGPDRAGELAGWIDTGPARHAWTLPDSTGGLPLQLIQAHAQ